MTAPVPILLVSARRYVGAPGRKMLRSTTVERWSMTASKAVAKREVFMCAWLPFWSASASGARYSASFGIPSVR